VPPARAAGIRTARHRLPAGRPSWPPADEASLAAQGGDRIHACRPACRDVARGERDKSK
jgi:hypothetical protein